MDILVEMRLEVTGTKGGGEGGAGGRHLGNAGRDANKVWMPTPRDRGQSKHSSMGRRWGLQVNGTSGLRYCRCYWWNIEEEEVEEDAACERRRRWRQARTAEVDWIY